MVLKKNIGRYIDHYNLKEIWRVENPKPLTLNQMQVRETFLQSRNSILWPYLVHKVIDQWRGGPKWQVYMQYP